MAPLLVELCAGTGVLSSAFRRIGWRTLTVDADPVHGTDRVVNVCELADLSELGDLSELVMVWGAPPCAQFTRTSLPWLRESAAAPDLSVMLAVLRLIRQAAPPLWAIENVKGAVPWFRPVLGSPVASAGGRSCYLWGQLPPLVLPAPSRAESKQRMTSAARIRRASYPARLCEAVASSCDAAWRLGLLV